jgi:hypothetical protein
MRVACAGTDAGVSFPFMNAGPWPVGSARGGPFDRGAVPGECPGDGGRRGAGNATGDPPGDPPGDPAAGAPRAGAAASPSATSFAPSRGQKRVVPP